MAFCEVKDEESMRDGRMGLSLKQRLHEDGTSVGNVSTFPETFITSLPAERSTTPWYVSQVLSADESGANKGVDTAEVPRQPHVFKPIA